MKVILADDHHLVRSGIRALLESITGVFVVAEAGDGREALEVALQNHILLKDPRVIITPHNAFNSEEALGRIMEKTVENIKERTL